MGSVVGLKRDLRARWAPWNRSERSTGSSGMRCYGKLEGPIFQHSGTMWTDWRLHPGRWSNWPNRPRTDLGGRHGSVGPVAASWRRSAFLFCFPSRFGWLLHRAFAFVPVGFLRTRLYRARPSLASFRIRLSSSAGLPWLLGGRSVPVRALHIWAFSRRLRPLAPVSHSAPVPRGSGLAKAGWTSKLGYPRSRQNPLHVTAVYAFLPWAAMSIEFMQPSKYARAGLGRNLRLPAPASNRRLPLPGYSPNPERDRGSQSRQI